MNQYPSPGELEIPLDDDEAERFTLAPESDDLPVLTDVVDERIEPYIGATPIILEPVVDDEPPLAAPPPPADPTVVVAERLVALDSAIGRHIAEWVATELPQLVSRELDELAERLAERAAAHLRATLLPQISAEIAEILDRDAES